MTLGTGTDDSGYFYKFPIASLKPSAQETGIQNKTDSIWFHSYSLSSGLTQRWCKSGVLA